ncbi:serine/threonine-protein phosphatase BSL3 [Tanacetum coccineum]
MSEPRERPTYPIIQTTTRKEDGPGPRCGHTLTPVAAIGDEGTPRLILFGGATALQGNGGIRLSGATADVHCYHVLTNKWSRITLFGEPPTPRAAHVATAIGTMVVIQGGIGPAGLSAEDLHVLDLTQQRPRWHRVVVQGPGPGPRYGHVMALVGQRYLMAIGGNDGKRPLADVRALDTAAKPYEWRKLEPEGEGPPPCITLILSSYFNKGMLPQVPALTVFFCSVGGHDANSVLVSFGCQESRCNTRLGRMSDSAGLDICRMSSAIFDPLETAYGLAKHRDGRWEWAIAPGVSPSPRYQHAAVFDNARLHVSGGALGGGRMVEDSSSVAVLDTAAGVWCDTQSVVTTPRTGRYSADAAGGDAAVELTRCCRHAATAFGDLIFIYGGLRGGVLLDDLLVAEDLAAAEMTSAASHAAAAAAASNAQSGRLPGRCGFVDDRTRQTNEAIPDGAVVLGNPVTPPVNGDMYADISTENAMLQGSRRLSKGVEYLVEASSAEAEAITATLAAAKARQFNGEVELPDRDRGAEATSSGKQISSLIKLDPNVSNRTHASLTCLLISYSFLHANTHRNLKVKFTMNLQVVIAAETGGALGGMVRQLSIDQFENEGRRVSYGTPENATAARKLLERKMSINNSVPKKVNRIVALRL